VHHCLHPRRDSDKPEYGGTRRIGRYARSGCCDKNEALDTVAVFSDQPQDRLVELRPGTLGGGRDSLAIANRARSQPQVHASVGFRNGGFTNDG
jgi:hypothetical protein